MIRFISILFITLFFACAAAAQTVTPATVTISKEAAVKCLENADRAKALETEVAAKDTAIDDLKKVITDLKTELAKTTGQLTGEQQQNVQNRAIIELLLKYARPKKNGVINF